MADNLPRSILGLSMRTARRLRCWTPTMYDFLKQKLLEAGIRQEKIFVKPNFIDATQITPAYGQGEYAVFLGRLSGEKGIWTLVRAFQQLKGISLKIVGTGPVEAELRRFLIENDMDNVEIVGFKSGNEKRQLLAKSMFLVLPSEWYETFGLVILEAYAAGKPVVASRIGSLPWLVKDGESGFLFTAGDIQDLAERVERLSMRPDEREAMGRFGRALVETEFGPKKNYELLIELFAKITRSRDREDTTASRWMTFLRELELRRSQSITAYAS